ncbi:PREDICTED: inactive hydroxysteroid dehydrogenase-like protein 1 [Nanorana parkeri]|uniref:inactive hydroxysteroid dehydrogenase-like protein 1 n=1 Tax=Nanorana parkeri TaxID=125878 RepID=UPI00085484B5|nr:PREDICTED: inactive hydroxysteroid dehydrogenase-like protein 1 [Nanorana parkeri]
MAAVDSFPLLYEEVARCCLNYFEFLAVVGALYTARKGISILHKCYSIVSLHVTPHIYRRRDLVKQYGEWAVVTEATDLIGRAYAEELARRGLNIILICSNKEELHNISEAISGTYGVNTNPIHADLSKGHEAYLSIKKVLSDLNVGILVNNAMVLCEYPQCIMDIPEDKLWDIINVNVAAAVMMVRIVVPGMVQRQRGAIVNVSPGTGSRYRDVTQIAASKVFLDKFSKELQSEFRSSGIFVQLLTPLCVADKHEPSAGILRKLAFFIPSSDVYARHAVRTLGVSSWTTGYWAHSLQLFAFRWVPGWMCTSVGRVIHH